MWAAGDCVESFHLVSRRPVHIALGTLANRQARVAGINEVEYRDTMQMLAIVEGAATALAGPLLTTAEIDHAGSRL